MENKPHWQVRPASPQAVDIATRFTIAHKWLVKLTDDGAVPDGRIVELHRIGRVLAGRAAATEGAIAHIQHDCAHGASIWLQWMAHHAPSLTVPVDLPGFRETRPSAELPAWIPS